MKPRQPKKTEDRRFYTWRRCSTCRNAKKVLDDLEISVTERDFFDKALSLEELRGIVTTVGIENLFSWRSPSAKPYRERRGTIAEDELIEAMLSEPRLIRRPIVISTDASPIVGFNADAYAKLNK